MEPTGFKPGEPESFNRKPPFYNELLATPGNYAEAYTDPDLPIATNTNRWETSEAERRRILACYYGMVSLMDHHIGRVLKTLDEIGELDNTCIVFASDHGDFLGDHGFWYKGVTAFEEGQRVPFIVRCPDADKKGMASNHFQNLVDIPRTFAALAGIRPPVEWEGVDQTATWKDPDKASRTFNIIEERPFWTTFNQRIIHEGDWKLCYYAGKDYGELYNLKEDPDQIDNHYDSIEHRDIRDQLIRLILDHEMNKRNVAPMHRDLHRHRRRAE